MRRQPQEFRSRAGSESDSQTSVPAPIGGLNARDSVANMDARDAVTMENWFPTPTSVDLRNGYNDWATFTGVCQTILIYSGVTATKVFACVKNAGAYSVFDGTSGGALSTAVVGGAGATIEALGGARFDYVNYSNSGGHFLVAVNGVNTPLRFDGTTWIASTLSGGTPANYQSIASYAKRLWVFEKNTFNVYYSAVDAVGGVCTLFDTGPLFPLGGSLAAIITVTDDALGLTDYIGFLSTEGEIVAYTGSDPSSASTWALSAHFRIGRPVTVGSRTWCKYGVDALVLCADGVYPLRKALASQDRNNTYAVSDKIRPLLNADVLAHGSKYGWQLMYHPTGAKLIVNVPTYEDVSSYQWVMNSQSRAWTKFTGWTAFCFEIARDTLYFGGNGMMVKADVGSADGENDITGDCKQAFNYFGLRGRSKQVLLMRPVLASTGTFRLGIAVNTDYKDTPISMLRTVSGGSGDPWGGVWDTAWSGGLSPTANWYGVNGLGHAIAPRLKAVANDVQVQWSATDVTYQAGGTL